MFPRDSGTKLESGFLRSGRRLRSDKWRKTCLGRGSCNTYREEEGYELASYLDEGYCDEEEEYHSIYEGHEDSKESTKAIDPERGYNSPEVISRDLSPSAFINTSSTNIINSRQGSSAIQHFVSTIPIVNTMDEANIKLPIFNGNGLEDP